MSKFNFRTRTDIWKNLKNKLTKHKHNYIHVGYVRKLHIQFEILVCSCGKRKLR